MTQRQIFILTFFKRINGIKYVLLKHVAKELTEFDDSSDLDILIAPSDLEAVLSIVNTDLSILKTSESPQASMHQIFLFFRDGSFLQVDLLFGFYRKSIEYLNKEEVFEHAVNNKDNLIICANHHLLEHVFLFQYLNDSAVPEKYIQYFISLAPSESQSLLDYLNNKYQLAINSFKELGIQKPNVQNKLKAQLNLNKENRGWNIISNRWRYWNDIYHRIKNKKGFTITFSGVDGAGKSTILEDTKSILKGKYRKNVVVLRHRPSILPILSAYRHGKSEAELIAASNLPRQGKNKSKIASIFRFGYYYLDYLFGQLYVAMKYHWRGYVVLYDRYYFDFIIDSKRSNIVLPKGLPKFFYQFIHHPDLNLFLYADAKTILERKKELNEGSIADLTAGYRSLFNDLSNSKRNDRYVSLENIDKEKTLKTIIDEYVDML